MKSNWEDINIGDFFIPDLVLNGDTFLYQKIDEQKHNGYNCILLNTGELCNIFINPNIQEHFVKVEVTFNLKEY